MNSFSFMRHAFSKSDKDLSIETTSFMIQVIIKKIRLSNGKARMETELFPATRALVERYPRARLVAWVREPVARIISYYHFWKREKPHGNPKHDVFLARKYSLKHKKNTSSNLRMRPLRHISMN
mgnify:CR=1 FL=1